ncbi:Rhodanese domain protein [Desulfarculus baarsii DSM 2075]|uniref:Rhodanese domain protein n=1 Tax=Desulfarculus baarsii (strain ATCC 33931 / DSM 2075 / LMG 7858 / VKM B-1802 / 2st14) TaxID=644282 RepID=E1QH58_DESB2|nr:rhodanese-like domain-containing protein [Desulfarculus baarsii]ADK84901.1 Rhodanese domain protein [Desulfarculus baarsii DSM 2075]
MRKILVVLLAFSLLAAPLAAAARTAQKAKTITPLEAWEMMSQDARDTFMIDVRPRHMYTLLGHPPRAYNIPWRFLTTDFQVEGGAYGGGAAEYTGYQLSAEPNPNFIGVVTSLFKPGDRLIVICQNGDQAADAADALVEAGFKNVHAVRHGVMGEPFIPADEQKLAQKFSPHYGQGGRVNGWVYWGLPLVRSIEPRLIYPPDLKKMQSTQ